MVPSALPEVPCDHSLMRQTKVAHTLKWVFGGVWVVLSAPFWAVSLSIQLSSFPGSLGVVRFYMRIRMLFRVCLRRQALFSVPF